MAETELESISVNDSKNDGPIDNRRDSVSTDSDALEVEWNKVSLSHGNKKLLFGVSGKVKGKFLAIMGGSGSGKVCVLSNFSSSFMIITMNVDYFIEFSCYEVAPSDKQGGRRCHNQRRTVHPQRSQACSGLRSTG